MFFWDFKLFLSSLIVVLFSSQAMAIKPQCEENWTPEYEMSDLFEVQSWAAIGALVVNAKTAGVEFDKQAYLDDCPSWILFNFGRATATTCLEVDVLNSYFSAAWALENKKRNLHQSVSTGEQESFQEYYLELAEQMGAAKYIIQ